jgi:D-alanine-D-alanine ligase
VSRGASRVPTWLGRTSEAVVVEIALAHNDDHELAAGEADDSIGVEGVLDQVRAVERTCLDLGWQVWRVPVGRDLPAVVKLLGRRRPDVVFSMVESVSGESRLEPAMAYLLEWLGLPYTGSPPVALALALHKPLARAVLADAGVAVPRGAVLENGDEPLDGLSYPVIVKPTREDGSHGIRNASVATSESAARARARYVTQQYAQPALVEEFIDGREFNVSLLGPAKAPVVLPLREIRYTLPADLPRLLGYEAKWRPETVEFQETLPATVIDPPELVESIPATARAAYTALGVRDYGRVDIRLDRNGRPMVLDVNPNPEIVPRGHFGLAATALEGGLSFPDLITFIVDQALARRPGSRG